jgi:hypothetical protein
MICHGGVGKKKRLSEHASELALPRGGGNPRFRAFAGLDDGTLGSTVTVNRQRSPRCRVAPTLWRPLSKKSGFCVIWMKRNFSLLLFQDDSSRGWSTVARAAMQDGRVPVTGRPSLPSWAACRICPLFCSFGGADRRRSSPDGCRISRSVLGSQICHYSTHQGRHIGGACRQLISLRASFKTTLITNSPEQRGTSHHLGGSGPIQQEED